MCVCVYLHKSYLGYVYVFIFDLSLFYQFPFVHLFNYAKLKRKR